MYLIWATDEFQLAARPKSGFPILLWDDMKSCREVNAFLRKYLVRGAIGSKKSWASTGRALYDFFSFLQVHELRWDEVDRGEEKNLIAAYRDYCFEVANLMRNTIRQRVLYVSKFYEFALQQGWIRKLPFEYEERCMAPPARNDFLQHVHAAGRTAEVRDVMPRHHKTLPKFLSKDQTKALMKATCNSHHRMIIRTALQTGLRREELATFPLAYVFDPSAGGVTARNVQVTLDPQDGTGMKTKGSEARQIWISRRLMQDLYYYAVQRRGERASMTSEKQQPLFLNQYGHPWAADGKGIETMVRKVGKKIGIETHPHMLRHTYATHTLVAMQRRRAENRMEPLVFVQKQLGHKSIKTTMIYLHLVNELADNAVLAYDDELNDLMDGSDAYG